MHFPLEKEIYGSLILQSVLDHHLTVRLWPLMAGLEKVQRVELSLEYQLCPHVTIYSKWMMNGIRHKMR